MFDRVGYLVWPDKHMILTEEELNKELKIGKIKYVYDSEDLYIVNTRNEENVENKGLWNKKTNRWEINPIYYTIDPLDTKKSIYALQKEDNGKYILFNLKTKQQIGNKSYDQIYSNGLVGIDKPNNTSLHFYIDIESGKEYRN